MVKFNVHITIDNFLVKTNSAIDVFINGNHLVSLHKSARSYHTTLVLPKAEISMIIKRRYAEKDLVKDERLIPKIFASIVVFLVEANSVIEPFCCLCEWEERIQIKPLSDDIKIAIQGNQSETEYSPHFDIQCDDCMVESTNTLSLSEKEITRDCKERKQLILCWFLIASVLLAMISTVSLFYNNRTTLLFCFFIFLLLLGCALYSLRSLKKQALRFRQKILSLYHDNSE